MVGRVRVVVMIPSWMRVKWESAAVTLCVAAGEGKRGDILCA